MSPPHAPGVPGTNLPKAASEVDGRSHRDSGEVRIDTLLENLYEAGQEKRRAEDAERNAEERATAAERELEALRQASALLRAQQAPGSVRPRGPSISLGDAKWWVIVIGALAAGSAGISALIVRWHELDRPTATQAQVTDVKQDVKESTEQATKRADALKKKEEDANERARIAAAFLCAQGLRADGLDCDALLEQIDFDAQPLHPKGPPLWHTRAKWPRLPDPPDK